ncbi:MAG: hypothetical protein AVDCRST_MAG34-2211 [uncultured Nocardioidaceae bacterium]|uniref:Uncharacterized protein n=1 Tax=uncultured Nocardioidaceae bacterium TaxID=253824 RepID=A0A6J4MEI5_9ACTN|nr:MAG: hypothetical protein AVDCRST_MAG34-2211 [uncultured Nocardioidaceae bacterium]
MTGAAERLREIAAELYGLRPEEFTPARTAAEKGARSEGDRELAAAIKALRRPAVAAWAVNRLVRERGELVGQVVALGESLREAQALLQGEALRDLTRQRRQLVTAVTAEARAAAAEQSVALSESATRQVEETLQAAMADPKAAEAVLSGLLAQPLSSTGVESLTDLVAVPLPERPPGRPQLSLVRDDGRARREAEERVAAAQGSLRMATEAVESLGRKRAKAQARLLQLEAELEELRRRVAEVEEATDAAAERLSELDDEVEEAEAGLRDARSEAEEAEAARDTLE